MQFNYNDGGRKEAGYKGDTGDCVCRAICITTGLPYQQVYDSLANGNATQRRGKARYYYDDFGRRQKKEDKSHGKRTASDGIMTGRKWFKDYMAGLGFTWVPTMLIGQGCKVHLTDGELPMGRLVVVVSKHMTSVIDGVINDTYNPERNTEWIDGNGTFTVSKRCVYGYYILNQGHGGK